jgi:hypothetical protein
MDRTQRHKDTEAGVGREEDRISRLRELLARTLDLAGVRGVAVVRGDDRPIEWFALDFEVVRGRSRSFEETIGRSSGSRSTSRAFAGSRSFAETINRSSGSRSTSRSFAVARGDDRPIDWFALGVVGCSNLMIGEEARGRPGGS